MITNYLLSKLHIIQDLLHPHARLGLFLIRHPPQRWDEAEHKMLILVNILLFLCDGGQDGLLKHRQRLLQLSPPWWWRTQRCDQSHRRGSGRRWRRGVRSGL